MMTRHQAWALVIAILFITSQPATCDDSETLHIVSSTNSPCAGELTGEPCITFSQYLSGEYRRYYKTDPFEQGEVVLEFGPGHHQIGSYRTNFASQDLAPHTQVTSFSMNSEHSAEIYRTDRNFLYLITNVHSVHISGIHFVYHVLCPSDRINNKLCTRKIQFFSSRSRRIWIQSFGCPIYSKILSNN